MPIDVLASVAGKVPRDRPMLVSPTGAYGWAELDQAVDEEMGRLAAEGVARGGVCIAELAQDVSGVLTLLAAWRLGAVVVPLNPRLTDLEKETARIALGRAGSVGADAQAVLWTSGTSGSPRGVVLSFENLRASSDAVAERLELSGSETWLASLSLAHVGGLALVVRALLTGATLVVAGGADTALVSHLIDGSVSWSDPAGPVTHVSVVPTQLKHLLDHRGGSPPPDTFRCALIGGAHAPEALVARALDQGWPLSLTYGMTEMTSQVATTVPEETRGRSGCVGRPLSHVELRVDDGEILVRGPTRATRYVGGDPEPLHDQEGWYHTGDLGRLGPDGALFVTGRRSDRIVTGGYTVDASEVEKVVRAQDGVADVCVVGIPDQEWGEVVGALVVPEGQALDMEKLAVDTSTALNASKRPRVWRTVPELPRNANGKVDRARARVLLRSEGETLAST